MKNSAIDVRGGTYFGYGGLTSLPNTYRLSGDIVPDDRKSNISQSYSFHSMDIPCGEDHTAALNGVGKLSPILHPHVHTLYRHLEFTTAA